MPPRTPTTPKPRLRPVVDVEEAAAVVFGLTSEDDLLGYVRSLAAQTGWLFYHPTFSIKGPSGFPDVVLVRERDGDVVIAELKREGLWPTVDRFSRGHFLRGQTTWLRALSRGAVGHFLWWPSDARDIADILTAGVRDDMACVPRLAQCLSRSGEEPST
jgi:hypothetical protein